MRLHEGWLDRADSDDGLLVVHRSLAPPSTLVPLLKLGGKTGLVVNDMTDVDLFESIVLLPDSPST